MSIVNLPSGYRQVEYIQSSGKQYVDTGFVPSQNSKIECDFLRMSTTAQYSGVYISGSYFAFGGGTNIELYYGNKYVSTTFPTERTTITIDGVSKTATVGETKYTFSSPTYTAGTNSLIIFALRRSATNIADYCYMRLFAYRVYDNGTLVRNFVPCIDPSGAVGLYDTVNAKFYGNSGTGVFTAGPYLAVDTPANFEQILAVYLRWGAVDCEAYKIFRNGSLLGTTTNTSYADLTAEQNAEYTYTLVAYRGTTESDPVELTVYTRSGYFVIKPLIESAFFQ